MTTISAFAPASSTARAESISQLVPGKAGMTKVGLRVITAGAAQESAWCVKVSMGRPDWSILQA